MKTFTFALILALSSVALGAPAPDPANELARSDIDKTGLPIYDFLIDYFERLIVFLRTVRTGDPNPQIAEIMPNGAGCADCDTINAFNPFGQMMKQLNTWMSSMNKYVQNISREANRIATNGK